MRTKTLLSIAALTAAGVASSMAQSNVYSLNIVGYCNVPTRGGYNFQSNPLNNGNNNATTLYPNPSPDGGASNGPRDGDNIQKWTGASWNVTVFDALTDDTTTGYTDVSGANARPAPVLASGEGYLYFNNNGSNVTTFVGDVRIGTNNLAMPVRSTPYAIGSMLPLTGSITSLGFTNINNGDHGPLDGCSFQSLRVTPAGLISGFDVSVWDSLTDDTTTGFTDVSGANMKPVPQVTIGQGFFFVNQSIDGAFTWKQVLNVGP